MEWYKIEPTGKEILENIYDQIEKDFFKIRKTSASHDQGLPEQFGVYMGKEKPINKNCYLVLPDDTTFAEIINKYNAKKCEPINFDKLVQLG